MSITHPRRHSSRVSYFCDNIVNTSHVFTGSAGNSRYFEIYFHRHTDPQEVSRTRTSTCTRNQYDYVQYCIVLTNDTQSRKYSGIMQFKRLWLMTCSSGPANDESNSSISLRDMCAIWKHKTHIVLPQRYRTVSLRLLIACLPAYIACNSGMMDVVNFVQSQNKIMEISINHTQNCGTPVCVR